MLPVSNITKENYTIYVGGVHKTVPSTSPDYAKLIEMYKAGDNDGLVNYVTAFKKAVETPYKKFGFTVENDRVIVNNKFLPKVLGDDVKTHADMGLSPDRFLKMWEKLQKNPSYSAVQSFCDFHKRNHLPITEDGNVVGYKVVRDDFKDNFSGKVDNTPGTTPPPIPRNECDDNNGVACSKGYHVGGYEYVLDYGSQYCNNGTRYIQVEFSPEDVVSVPRDSSQNKIRVCKYSVIKEIKKEEVADWKDVHYKSNDTSDIDDQEEGYNVCDDKSCPDCGSPAYDYNTDYCDDCDDRAG